jgi:hypothetical protein
VRPSGRQMLARNVSQSVPQRTFGRHLPSSGKVLHLAICSHFLFLKRG